MYLYSFFFSISLLSSLLPVNSLLWYCNSGLVNTLEISTKVIGLPENLSSIFENESATEDIYSKEGLYTINYLSGAFIHCVRLVAGSSCLAIEPIGNREVTILLLYTIFNFRIKLFMFSESTDWQLDEILEELHALETQLNSSSGDQLLLGIPVLPTSSSQERMTALPLKDDSTMLHPSTESYFHSSCPSPDGDSAFGDASSTESARFRNSAFSSDSCRNSLHTPSPTQTSPRTTEQTAEEVKAMKIKQALEKMKEAKVLFPYFSNFCFIYVMRIFVKFFVLDGAPLQTLVDERWNVAEFKAIFIINVTRPTNYISFGDLINTHSLEFFSRETVAPPELEGFLYLKSDGRKNWKKHFFVLRPSGLYYSPKGRNNLYSFLFDLRSNYQNNSISKKYSYSTNIEFFYTKKYFKYNEQPTGTIKRAPVDVLNRVSHSSFSSRGGTPTGKWYRLHCPTICVIISNKNLQNGTFQVSSKGMQIIVDDQNCEQAIAYIQCETFAAFTIREPVVNFRVPLHILTECMTMLEGNNMTLKMTYGGFGKPLRLLMEEDGIVVQASVSTFNPEPVLDFDFDSEDIAMKTIMKPALLRETIKEFDQSSPTVFLDVSYKRLSFITQGELGRIKTTFPRHSEQVERLECPYPMNHQYQLTLMKRMTTALSISNKVSLRCDSRGILSAQLMIDNPEQHQIFIEFFCVPDSEDYD
uniref:PH domain-containing protein n=1 Tax=Heterorhabditis bacteriophora TaxID=37862 RepID=A0A1I7WZQ0_HETBA